MTKWKWLYKYLQGHWLVFVGIGICVIMLAILGVGNAWCFQNFVNIGAHEAEMELGMAIVYTIVIVLMTGVCNIALEALRRRLSLSIQQEMKKDLLGSMLNIPLRVYEEQHTADLQSRLSDDVSICSEIIPISVVTLFSGAISCIAGFAYAIHLSWKLTLIVLVLTPLAGIWGKKLTPLVERATNEQRKLDTNARAYTQEILNDPITTRVYDIRTNLMNKFLALHDLYAKATVKRFVLMNIVGVGGGTLGFLSFAASMAIGAGLAVHGEMTIGAVMGFVQLLNFIVWPFSELMGQISGIKAQMVSVQRVQEVMEFKENENIVVKQIRNAAELRIEHLSFGYKKGENVLKDLNASFAIPGILRISGESGSGKSTLLKLFLGLYTPDVGDIFLLDEEGRILSSGMYGNCAFVSQEHILISGTIRENICMGRNVSEEDYEIVLRRAKLWDFVQSLPQKSETYVHQNAQNLSFGQAQRISIARALIQDAPILILDEPTASLDMETKKDIFEVIRQEGKRRLCIIVSHDALPENMSVQNLRL